MSLAWFYVSDIPEPGKLLVLDGREAKHACAARRLIEGDELVLFDGLGAVATSQINTIEARGGAVHVQVIEREHHPAVRPVMLAVAPPKGDRLWTMLNMLTQLGMTMFTPLLCRHGVVKPRPAMADRAQRIFLEACKQSRQAFVPVVGEPQSPAQIAQSAAARGERILLAHPSGAAIHSALCEASPDEPLVLMIGPEGGFTDDEVIEVQSGGGSVVGLGRSTLRVETAAVAMLSAIRLAQ